MTKKGLGINAVMLVSLLYGLLGAFIAYLHAWPALVFMTFMYVGLVAKITLDELIDVLRNQ